MNAVLLQVVRDVDRLERDRRVEVAEEDDQHDVDDVVEPVAGWRARRCAASSGVCDERRDLRGNIRSDEAKIGGMTPAVLTLSGRCVVCPPYTFRPTTPLGVLDRDPPLAALEEDDRGDDRDDDQADDGQRSKAVMSPASSAKSMRTTASGCR